MGAEFRKKMKDGIKGCLLSGRGRTANIGDAPDRREISITLERIAFHSGRLNAPPLAECWAIAGIERAVRGPTRKITGREIAV